MPISDYAHWNEEAELVWWQEEGRHAESDAEYDREDSYCAADAYAEDLAEMEDDDLLGLLEDAEYLARWPKAEPLIRFEISHRGL